MKMQYKNIFGSAVLGLLIATSVSSCVDEIRFGDAFLEKAPGGTVTQDTVFNSAKYTKQFLTGIYALQYYGLPHSNDDQFPYPNDTYRGKWEMLSDCWHNHWEQCRINRFYYTGSHSAGDTDTRAEKFSYLKSNVWEAVRYVWILIENIDRVPDLTEDEKMRMVSEAKCVLAARYFDMFRHYGGLPIVRSSFTGTDANYEMPRASVEETVNFIIGLLDEAKDYLPWAFSAAEALNETGRWTRAGAMAMKCRVWHFAASPLFNDMEPYYPGSTDLSTWYGGYKPELWDNCLKACEEFIAELNSKGGYALVQASGNRPQDYRLAFRKAYSTQESSELLHSTRVYGTDGFRKYNWIVWQQDGVKRLNYTPTQEYIEMFPWADGKPFVWDAIKDDKTKMDEMFMSGTAAAGVTLTRDPRLYETAIVNGLQKSLDWTTGNMSGNIYECWVGGTDAQNNPAEINSKYATGYANNKFFMENDLKNRATNWPYLRLPEIYYIYAEAIVKTGGNLLTAISYVDKMRERVGMKGLVECNPDKNLDTDADALMEEILRERVCELGLEDVRFFDMIRNKMKERFEMPLHGLRIYRLDANGIRTETAWTNGDKSQNAPQPTHFEYEKFELTNYARYWWTHGFDPKWYLSPFPSTEVNKGYGLQQNPGW
ncbi:RagB/SusD family nutrient uptake outer membrane protein [uncultured Bacteroides sp.]|jgi:putative lipoprotein|uniref:RagB/SusD family nutrient uptake outer membrane protein n=1 Tax=uncultured Bacteroides sp. TaxID=162156 RepID=UPI00280A9F90|nr:RagB/SusD family nutrient uptake outer membrane protein [uncultured Bacteroides sp.]